KRAKQSGCIHNYPLEHCAGSARSISRSTRGVGKTLPHLLATCLWFHQATRHQTGGGGRSYPRVLFAPPRAARFQCCSQRERTIAFLSSNIAETLPRQ